MVVEEGGSAVETWHIWAIMSRVLQVAVCHESVEGSGQMTDVNSQNEDKEILVVCWFVISITSLIRRTFLG